MPQPTYGLYAQASRAAGARVERVPSPELRLDLERIADAARRSEARIAWICDPNNPTGSLIDPADWDAFLHQLPPGCLVVADEAYIDYVEPATRIRREDDVRGAPPGRAAHLLEDLRARRPAARLRDRRSRARSLPADRAGALQRQPPRARRGARQPRPSGRARRAPPCHGRGARSARRRAQPRGDRVGALGGELPARPARRRRRRPVRRPPAPRGPDPSRRRDGHARLGAHHRRPSATDAARGRGTAGGARRAARAAPR